MSYMIAALFFQSVLMASSPPEEEMKFCTMDARQCPDGSFVARDPKKNCEFKACSENQNCSSELKVCPDGSSVARDPAKQCEFAECPKP